MLLAMMRNYGPRFSLKSVLTYSIVIDIRYTVCSQNTDYRGLILVCKPY